MKAGDYTVPNVLSPDFQIKTLHKHNDCHIKGNVQNELILILITLPLVSICEKKTYNLGGSYLSLIRAVAGQRSSPDLCFATKSIKIYDQRHSPQCHSGGS